ncbi:hypothetical protein VPH35_044526 [Triticum aestivum]
MFEGKDSYNYFSLALLHLDVNRRWKVLWTTFKVYRICTILLQFILMKELTSSSLSKLVLLMLLLCALLHRVIVVKIVTIIFLSPYYILMLIGVGRYYGPHSRFTEFAQSYYSLF